MFYTAPLDDMRFLLRDVWPIATHLAPLACFEHVSADITEAVLQEAGRVAEQVLFPLLQTGDAQGCQFNAGQVSTPEGFKSAYRALAEGGWVVPTARPEHGGQQLPHALSLLIDELFWSANNALFLTPNLTHGVYRCLSTHASEQLKQDYLPKMVSGEWTGVMCLTEPHCGTDLGLLNTKAEPVAGQEGSYHISGTKIFITSGEHDLTENIVHVVLARLPDAPAGVKGISLFLVPKYLTNDAGELTTRNAVSCGSIEHKMGLNASSTCVMNYDAAVGYLVGEPHRGLQAMFTVMNAERVSIGLQGLGLAELAYQNAAQYAKERLQGRAPTGAIYPDKPADPLLVHPDIRRLLLNIRSFVEGGRALTIWMGQHLDNLEHHPQKKLCERSGQLVNLFTPVIKAFFTDEAFRLSNDALQVLGGHGYVKEWGLEQIVRDARIAQLYEGANGIQGLDLVRRKLIADKGEAVGIFLAEVDQFLAELPENLDCQLDQLVKPLQEAVMRLRRSSDWIIQAAVDNPAEAGAAATPYLTLFGLTAMAYMWLRVAVVASQSEAGYARDKLVLARYFILKRLPESLGLEQVILAGSETLMAPSLDFF